MGDLVGQGDDLMTALDDSQSEMQHKVQSLHRQAIDARTEGRYADQEDTLKRIVDLVDGLEEPHLQVKERYWLADAQRMQYKYKEAISVYEWLIGRLPNSESLRQADKNSLYYLAGAYIYFVECGRHVPDYFLSEEEVKAFGDKLSKKAVKMLQDKIEEGIAWLEKIKKPGWSAGLHLQWGLLLRDRGELQEARTKLHEALDLAREYIDAPGYTLATYQLELADLLCDMGFPTGALHLAEEVSADSSLRDLQRAYKRIVYAQMETGDMAALHTATLKDQPLNAGVKNTASVDKEILKQLQSINQKLGRIAADLYRIPYTSSVPEQQSTAQTALSEKSTNEQAGQPEKLDDGQAKDFGKLVLEQARDFGKLVLEQARDFGKLVSEQSAIQVSHNATDPIPEQVASQASSGEKNNVPKTCIEHIVCLVALPSKEKDANFRRVLLPALRYALELEPFYWRVACEDEEIYETRSKRLNFLSWLNRAQVYIVDITSNCLNIMIELGAMLVLREHNRLLLVLQEEGYEHDFTSIQGMIDNPIQYCSFNKENTDEGSTQTDIKRIGTNLNEKFCQVATMTNLNQQKKAHYLSPLYLKEKNGLNEVIARKISSRFNTMESIEAATDEALRHHAASIGIGLEVLKHVKASIITKLRELKEGGKHDDQSSESGQ